LLVLAISAVVFTGCAASMRVNSFADRGTDFARYRTYSWDAAGRQATGDPRLDNNPFFHERLRTEVENQLAARGLARITIGTPELLVRVHTSMAQRIDPGGADAAYGVGQGNGYADYGEPYVYDAGTITIDFIDARTNKVVWRGWVEGNMDGVVDDQTWMERKIDTTVTRILSRLPRVS
jgi:hypothetical protein